VRSISDPDNIEAEFAVLIRSDWTGKGVGYALMSAIVEYCRAKGTGQIFGEVLAHNHRMVELGVTLGFRPALHDGGVRLTLPLRQSGAGA